MSGRTRLTARWAVGWERPALAALLERVGIREAGYELVQSSRGRAVFRSLEDRLIVRVIHPSRAAVASNELRFARWARSAGLPIAGPVLRFGDEPVSTPMGSGSFWPLYDPVPPTEVDLEWFGRTLRRLHDVGTLPPTNGWCPEFGISAALDRVRGAMSVERDVCALFVDRANRALSGLAWVRRGGADVPIHGDASIENVVAHGSEYLLIDFESSGIGPGAYDLAPIQTRARRFGGPWTAVESMVRAHGGVATQVNEAMVNLHEVLIVCGAVVPHMERSGRFRDEFVLRVTTLDDPEGPSWTPHLRLLMTTALEQ